MSKIKSPEEWNKSLGSDQAFRSDQKHVFKFAKDYHEYASKLERDQKVEELDNLFDDHASSEVQSAIIAAMQILEK